MSVYLTLVTIPLRDLSYNGFDRVLCFGKGGVAISFNLLQYCARGALGVRSACFILPSSFSKGKQLIISK